MPIDTSKVKKLIQENLKQIHTVRDLAERLRVSPETLRKDFSRKERVALSRYVIHAKIEEMKRRLATTDDRCFEICYDVGFQREDTGAKVFKRLTGRSMEEFRTRCGNGKRRG